MVEVIRDQDRALLRTVAVLAFSSAFVAQFAAQGVVLFLREAGAPSHLLSFIYLAAIPYTLRFVWAPVIDRWSLGGRGRFDRWILATQAAVCAVLALMIFLDPATAAVLIIVCVSLLLLALGTLQTAVGGLMVEGLSTPIYPRGASVQAATSAFAGFLLGLVVLYLIGPLGWSQVIWALLTVAASLLVVSGLWLQLTSEVGDTPGPPPKLWSQLSIFARSDARHLLLVSVLISSALLIPYALKSVLLIDAGFTVSQGGLIGIVFGNAMGFAGAMAVRPLVERIGGLRVLGVLGVCNGAVVLALGLLASEGLPAWGVVALVLYANFGVFAAYTANRAVLMPLCAPGRQATELAGFVGVEAILFLILAGGAVSVLDTVGLAPLLMGGGAVSLISVCLLTIINRRRRSHLA